MLIPKLQQPWQQSLLHSDAKFSSLGLNVLPQRHIHILRSPKDTDPSSTFPAPETPQSSKSQRLGQKALQNASKMLRSSWIWRGIGWRSLICLAPQPSGSGQLRWTKPCITVSCATWMAGSNAPCPRASCPWPNPGLRFLRKYKWRPCLAWETPGADIC